MQLHLCKLVMLCSCFGLFTKLYPAEQYSIVSSTVDTTISCFHWIFCPYCLFDAKRQINNFQTAIDANDTQAIKRSIRRRDMSPNQQLPDGSLPIIYAAKKAHVESIKQLLALGSDVNSQMQGNYPSSLIAVCATEDLSSDRVYETVQVLLDNGADPTRTCIMLTDKETIEFGKLREEFQQNPTKEKEILSRIPQDWFKTRTALDFAVKHKYTATILLIRQALANPQKGIKPHESDNY